MIPLFVRKRTISLHFQMAWQHCIFFVGYLAFQGCANCAHFRTRKAAGEILVFHTDLRPSNQDFQLNCCNKLPITVAAPFSQLMPDTECVTLAVSCISLLYCFFTPIPCPSDVGVTPWTRGLEPGAGCSACVLGLQWTFTTSMHTQHVQHKFSDGWCSYYSTK